MRLGGGGAKVLGRGRGARLPRHRCHGHLSVCVCVCVCLCIIVGVSDECVPSHLSIFASLCVYFCLEIAFTITITNGSTINTRLEQGASFWRLVRIDERKLLAEANLGR